MGTRSLINVYDEDNTIITTIYNQYDGYPEGIGQDIYEQFKGKVLVNGYSNPSTEVNGMKSLAAMLVAGMAMPDNTGGCYIYPSGTKDCGEDYTYNIFPDGKKILMEVISWNKSLWKGNLEDYPNFLDKFLNLDKFFNSQDNLFGEEDD